MGVNLISIDQKTTLEFAKAKKPSPRYGTKNFGLGCSPYGQSIIFEKGYLKVFFLCCMKV